MKAISAALVILAGAILLASAIHVGHGDTQVAMGAVAAIVGVVGIYYWLREMNRAG